MLANFRLDLLVMMQYCLLKTSFEQHTVTKFQVTFAGVHSTDGHAGNFMTECLNKVVTFFDQYGIK